MDSPSTPRARLSTVRYRYIGSPLTATNRAGMADTEKALKRLERAAARARKAEDDLAEARAQLRQALADARDEGASISELARRLGVSRQRVYALLD